MNEFAIKFTDVKTQVLVLFWHVAVLQLGSKACDESLVRVKNSCHSLLLAALRESQLHPMSQIA